MGGVLDGAIGQKTWVEPLGEKTRWNNWEESLDGNSDVGAIFAKRSLKLHGILRLGTLCNCHSRGQSAGQQHMRCTLWARWLGSASFARVARRGQLLKCKAEWALFAAGPIVRYFQYIYIYILDFRFLYVYIFLISGNNNTCILHFLSKLAPNYDNVYFLNSETGGYPRKSMFNSPNLNDTAFLLGTIVNNLK